MSQAAPERQAKRDERRGASMSNKQIAKAATRGRKVTFRFLGSQPYHEVTGYVVGMDDYHWLVASVRPLGTHPDEEDRVSTFLIHKSRADVISLASASTLEGEEATAKQELEAVGRPFWSSCQRLYDGA